MPPLGNFYLIFENIWRVHYVISSYLPQLLSLIPCRSIPIALQPILTSFSIIFIAQGVQCVLSINSLENSQLPRHRTSSSPSSQQLSIGSWLGGGICECFPTPCWDIYWLDLVQDLFRHPQLSWVNEYIGSVMSQRHCFTMILPNLWSLQYFCSLFHIS